MDKRCILCGRRRSVGLNIGGCLLCFECEKRLLRPAASHMRAARRRRLARLYAVQG